MKEREKPCNILIVEDEEDQRVRLKYVLESDGYKVEEAKTGDEAVEMVKGKFYDLVITDVKMPGENDGLDVLRHVKKVSDRMEVIIVSAYGTIESAVRAMLNGAFDYIQKPIHIPELRIRIERALANRETVKKLDAKDILSNNISALSKEIEFYKKRLADIKGGCQAVLKHLEGLENSLRELLAKCGEK